MKGNLSARFNFPIWTGRGFYFLCTCLSHPFLWEQTQSVVFLERILAYSGFRFGNSSFPPGPPEARCESLLVFYCTDERTRGKDRLVYVEWSSRKINMADLLLWAGQASHLLPACPYSHPQNWKWTCFPGHLITARQMEVLLLDSLSKFHVCCLA